MINNRPPNLKTRIKLTNSPSTLLTTSVQQKLKMMNSRPPNLKTRIKLTNSPSTLLATCAQQNLTGMNSHPPNLKTKIKLSVKRRTGEMPTGIRPFHTKCCIHSMVCQNHHSQGVSQHCLPRKPSPVPQKTGGKNNLVPTYRTLRQPLHSLSNNPDICRRQKLHLKGSHDFHLCSVHLHRLPPLSTARQIFLHDSLHHSITLAFIHRAQITSPPDSSPFGGHSISILQIGGVAMMPLGLTPVLPSEEHLASNIGLESPTLYEM